MLSRIRDPLRRGRRLLDDARAVARLGASRSAAAKILLLHLAMPVKHRIAALHRRPVSLRVSYRGVQRTMTISDASEMLTLKEILVEGEYDLSAFRNPRTVLDLGANVGVATLFFRAHYPNAHIVAVEPDPRTFEKLARNVVGDRNVTAVNAAVAPQSGPVSFLSDGMSWTSRLAEAGDAPTRVTGVTLDELADRFDAGAGDLIKVDIEGAEHVVLPGARCLDRVDMLIGEVHSVEPEAPQRLFEELERRGWRHCRPVRRRAFAMTREPPSDAPEPARPL